MISLGSLQSDLHSVSVKTETGNELAISASGEITISNTSFIVSATDLDIRNLAFATDSVDVSGSSVSVSAIDLDIRDLAFATDSVTAHQGGSWSFTMDNISSWKSTAQTVSNTASELAATPLANRNKMIIQNLGNQDAYIGPDNLVTTTNGIKLPKGSSLEYPFDSFADVWAITGAGSSDIRILEAAS